MPLPPLVPDQHPLTMPRETKSETSSGDKTDANAVMSFLSGLDAKMLVVADKLREMQLDERKHYDSVRRGLKRLKEDKDWDKEDKDRKKSLTDDNNASDVPTDTNSVPLCICNYCLKRTSFFGWWGLMGSACGDVRVVSEL